MGVIHSQLRLVRHKRSPVSGRLKKIINGSPNDRASRVATREVYRLLCQRELISWVNSDRVKLSMRL